MLGAIRQEVLSGVREGAQFVLMKERLASFPDLPLERRDYEEAAAMFNRCRARGVQGSNTDFLICSVAVRRDLLVYTEDKDFNGFAKHVRVKLYQP
jgi:predicted nucleic acid-binding protein